MRVAPVSADLLVKLALGAAVIGAAVWAVNRAASAAAAPVAAVADAAWAITPWNPDNVFAGVANDAVSAVVGYEETVGGWLHDVFNPDPMAEPLRWERVETPGGSYVLGAGGAAFGIYPRP